MMMSLALQQLVHRIATVAVGFAPFGTYCLMLGDEIRIIDSIAQPKLLQFTESQLFKAVQNVGKSRGAAPVVQQRFLTEHDIQSYKDVLQTANQSMVPLLFMDGTNRIAQSVGRLHSECSLIALLPLQAA